MTRVPLPVLIEMLPRGRIAACSEVQVLYSLIVFVGEFLLFDSFLIVKLQNKFIICKYISNPVMLGDRPPKCEREVSKSLDARI